MKLRRPPSCRTGSLSMELVVATSVLTLAVIPFGFSFLSEQRLMRHAHHRAVALELVDGEAEILAAGALVQFPEGESNYPLTVGAATNLPPGSIVLRRRGSSGELEWRTEKPLPGGKVHRAFRLRSEGGVR